jgi:hypothetical protein
MKLLLARAALLLSILVMSGCDAIPPEYEKYWVKFERGASNFLITLSGHYPDPSGSARPSESPTVDANGEGSGLISANARNSKANSELLHEMYEIVYIREPKDRSEFGSMVDSMNQGASLEGVYNGYTHSADYRKLEIANAGASPEALQVFGQELAILELELPTPADFDAAATQPLAMPVDPASAPAPLPTPVRTEHADGVHVIEYGKVPEPGAEPSLSSPVPKPDINTLADRYTKQFVGASIFTLKRVLGDEALHVVADKKQHPEKLAMWYAKWVVHMAARGVDFGIALRNKPDFQFHYDWAIKAGQDRIEWEVLNRIHRVLNEANKQKQ